MKTLNHSNNATAGQKSAPRYVAAVFLMMLLLLLISCKKKPEVSVSEESVSSTMAMIKPSEESVHDQLIIINNDEPETAKVIKKAEEPVTVQAVADVLPDTINIPYEGPSAPAQASPGTTEKKTMQLEKSAETGMYTYEMMKEDLKYLSKSFPQLVSLSSLTLTFDSRELYCLRIGNEDAPHKVLLSAAIHAREYLTTELLMKQAVSYIDSIIWGQDYNGRSCQQLSSECCVYIIPMVNPDGVTVSQLGPEALITDRAKEAVKNIAATENPGGSRTYFNTWKSNAEGIDLNRQFDALWDQYNDHVGRPSADHYKGTAPGATAEAGALIKFTEQMKFDRTVSYHTAGSVIYWYFGQEGKLYDDTKAFAQKISSMTGYPLDANYQNLDPAGYKDWAIIKMGIPSLTIEVGSGASPLPHSQLDTIYERNKHVIEETCISCTGN